MRSPFLLPRYLDEMQNAGPPVLAWKKAAIGLRAVPSGHASILRRLLLHLPSEDPYSCSHADDGEYADDGGGDGDEVGFYRPRPSQRRCLDRKVFLRALWSLDRPLAHAERRATWTCLLRDLQQLLASNSAVAAAAAHLLLEWPDADPSKNPYPISSLGQRCRHSLFRLFHFARPARLAQFCACN